jgi:adiponectin receptor
MAMGLTGIVPMTHAALTFGVDQANRQMGWYWYIQEALWYIGGAVIYVVSLAVYRANSG